MYGQKIFILLQLLQEAVLFLKGCCIKGISFVTFLITVKKCLHFIIYNYVKTFHFDSSIDIEWKLVLLQLFHLIKQIFPL